jgi:hypothetical protein
MGNRKPRRGHDPSRDPGGFLALPWSVLDSPAYLQLSHPSKALLLEIARQLRPDNNGRLLASRRYLKTRGWNSSDTISRALRELLEGKLIHQTVLGHRPNKASWFAVTWRALDRHAGYDPGATASFERSGYAKNRLLRPSGGLEKTPIAPPTGQATSESRPHKGPISVLSNVSSSPQDGHHLDKPSVRSSPLHSVGPGLDC